MGQVYVWQSIDGRGVRRFEIENAAGQIVDGVAFSADGKWISAVSQNGHVNVWDFESGETLQQFRVNSSGQWTDFSPDGRTLVAGGAIFSEEPNSDVTLWDLSTGRATQQFACLSRGINSARFLGDGQLVAIFDGRRAEIIDPAKSIPVHEFENVMGVIGGSRDGELVVLRRENVVEIRRLADGERVMEFPQGGSVLGSTDCSLDEKLLAVCGSDGRQGVVCVWELETGKQLFRRTCHNESATHVRFSPDGKTLVSTGDDEVILAWDPRTGERKLELDSHEGAVLSVAYSAGGEWIATGGHDDTVRLWDPKSSELLLTLEDQNQPVSDISFSPDDRFLIGHTSESGACVWEIEADGRSAQLRSFSGPQFHSPYLSADGTRLIGMRGLEQLSFDLSDGQFLEVLHPESVGRWNRVAHAPDGKQAAFSGDVVVLVDHLTGSRQELLRTEFSYWSQSFSRDGFRLATLRTFLRAGTILQRAVHERNSQTLVHDTRSGKVIRKFETGGISALSSDGRMIAIGSRESTRVFDVDSGQEIAHLPYESSSLAFAPDDRHLVTNSERSAVIWDLKAISE
jgi:WD40 repeat protein